MEISAGTRLGPHEIVSLLGAGGMGEVYRARDTRLKRDVAIKLLPSSVAQDLDRRQRFEREAQMLASLNHPHIGAIYGFEEAEGLRGLVLELVEGPTLADRIAQGPLTIGEALRIARQIADALEAAHERAIIHRDLKPANVKVRRDGTVKVLDFGLARVCSGDGPGPDLSQSPTATASGTREGVVLGTPAYMSPEQARGRPLDRRTDIWAFGCVLYEMLTGRRAFGRDTTPDSIAAILEREPEWFALPKTTPVAVRRLLRRCLEKNPKLRLRDIGDARIEIDEALAGSAGAAPPATRTAPHALAWMLSGALVASGLFTGWRLIRAGRSPATAGSAHLQRITDFVGMEDSPAISPDGKTVAFVTQVGGKRQIWLRLLAGGAPLQITRDDSDHEKPRWAPDSSSLVYYAPAETPGDQGTLREIDALGGPPRRIAESLGGGDISHDGRHIAVFRFQEGHNELAVMARDGSRLEHSTPLPAEYLHEQPRWSPDDRWLAFQRSVGIEFDKRIYVVSSAGGAPREIARADDLRGLTWLPDGTGLVYSSPQGSTIPYPPTFNLRVVGRDGSEDRALTFGDVSYVDPDMNGSGKLLTSRIRIQSDVWAIPLDGSPAENVRGAVRVTRQTGQAQTPSASPDGTELVYLCDSGGHANLWVAKADGSGVRQITFERDPAVSVGVPVWSPRRGQIAFVSSRAGAAGQWLINADGSGLRQLIPRGVWAYWSGDGQWLYYTVDRNGSFCIEKMPLDGAASVTVRCDDAVAPTVSADGSTLYFATPLKRASGGWDWEIHRARPENGPSQALARVAGSRVPVDALNIQAILSPDEKWLAMPLTDGTTSNLWALPADGGPMRPLTDFGERGIVIARRISWSPDGRRLYAAVAETDADVVLLEGLLR